MRSIGALLLVLSTASAALLGCAQEVGDVDRTDLSSPGIPKSFFDGEWYYQRTVVDTPSANGFTFVGQSNFAGLAIIKWDLQEDWLYARRNIELIEGADDLQAAGDNYQGEVVAAFPVSHFDVQRAYNAQTGEQTNEIIETMSERPWYDREFVRVDWSRNWVTNYDLDFETASVEPIAYFVQDTLPDGTPNPDAPFFEPDGSYFDITSKMFARAGSVYIDGYGEAPSCWLFGHEFDECGAGEYSIRNSFLRRDPTHQYVPMPYKGAMTDLFGFFTADRMTYDPREGIREQNKTRYLTRHNLWVNWYDPNDCTDPNDPATCREIPVAERTLRPIVYHVNTELPDDLKPMVAAVGAQWDGVFRDVVAAMGYPLRDDEHVFIACVNNPIREGDPAACGAPGTSPRLGDLRYSFMAYVPKFMQYGLLGLGPNNNDPITGEVLSGMAYVYHHNNLAAYNTAEMIELLNAPEDSPLLTEFIEGTDITEWADEVRGTGTVTPRTFSLADASEMTHSIANGWMTQYWDGQRREITPADVEQMRTQGFASWARPFLDDMYERGLLNGETTAAEGRLAALRGTYIEDLLLNDEVLAEAGRMPGEAITDAQRDRASVARGGLGAGALQRARLREQFAAANNMYLPEMADDALMGIAHEYRDAGLSFDEIYNDVRSRIYTAVWAHEVGHTLGLMHNFGGSDDVFNYDPQYWAIRTADGTVAPRTEDPITQTEVDANIYNYAYSSVMDYAGRYTVDGAGIGRYDRAAMLFGYAGLIEVYKDAGSVPFDELKEWDESDGDVITGGGSLGIRTIHYTSYYNRMGELMYDEDNRLLVPLDQFDPHDYSQVTIENEGSTQTLARVPYIYCSHSSSDLSDHCLTRDSGADSMERMKNILDDLNTWYILRNFPRGRIGVSTYGYVDRYYGRTFSRLKDWNNLYGLYSALLAQFFTPTVLEGFLNDPESGFGAKTWAVQNAFNYLVQTLLMPDVGDYDNPRLQADGTRLAGSSQSLLPAFSLGINDARYYSTNWSFGGGDGRDCGYMWYECLDHIGFYLDKVMAIEALTDSSTNFVARSTPLDIREWEVSYYNTFPDSIAAINQAIMSQNWATVAPYYEGGELRFPNYAGSLNSSRGLTIDPAATFTLQLYWQVLGQARFPNNYDRGFVQESRVFELGTGAAPDLASENLITFTNTENGISYGAIKFSDRQTAGAAMIQRARCLDALAHRDDSPDLKDGPFIECDAYQGIAEAERDSTRLPTAAAAAFELRQYTDLFEIVADMSFIMDYGDPYNP
ncbi:MAG: zinc-dependent metalloprotease [Myxococcales bacterium]|nr:zinc-dependent metalloprotease [Myxococcales bacterium]